MILRIHRLPTSDTLSFLCCFVLIALFVLLSAQIQTLTLALTFSTKHPKFPILFPSCHLHRFIISIVLSPWPLTGCVATCRHARPFCVRARLGQRPEDRGQLLLFLVLEQRTHHSDSGSCSMKRCSTPFCEQRGADNDK